MPRQPLVREDWFVEQDDGIRTHGWEDVVENLTAFYGRAIR